MELTATIQIANHHEGDAEPRAAATLVVDAQGFHDPSGLGNSGSNPDRLELSEIRRQLLDSFDREQLRAIFDQIARLRSELSA